MAEEPAAGILKRHENYTSYNDLMNKAINVNRIATDEYFRVKKQYNEVEDHPIYRGKDFYSNYKTQKRPRSQRGSSKKFKVPIHDHD